MITRMPRTTGSVGINRVSRRLVSKTVPPHAVEIRYTTPRSCHRILLVALDIFWNKDRDQHG